MGIGKKDPRVSGKRGSKFERLRVARVAAVQACYQAKQLGQPLFPVKVEFIKYRLDSEDYPTKGDATHFSKILDSLDEHAETITAIIQNHLQEGWELGRMDPVLTAILRVALGEMLLTPPLTHTPTIIAEYVEVTKGFFDGNEASFVNKTLDSAAHRLGLRLTGSSS
jgi:N utilization substance protein B